LGDPVTFLFISHSSADRLAAERLLAELRDSGFGGVFCDVDPADGIASGRQWEHELYAALRRCDGVIFLATSSSAASRWCFAELALARSLGTPIFAVRDGRAFDMSIIADLQSTDLATVHGYAQLLAGLRRAGLDPDDSFRWDPRRPPYPGLDAFAIEDAAMFFGRDREIDNLIHLVNPSLTRGAGRWIGIVGPSGSGKSSLLRAGLLPRLTRMRDRWIVVPPFVPDAYPTRQLAKHLARALADEGVDRGTSGPAKSRPPHLGSAGELCEVVAELGEHQAAARRNVVIAVDQTEELLTRASPADRQSFLELLSDALHQDAQLWVVSTLRSEFLRSAPDQALLSEVLDESVVVEPLNRNRLTEVIARPARRAGIEFEDGLVHRMVDETTGGDALPLLAYTLHELHAGISGSTTIRIKDYEQIGGVVGALTLRADQVVDELTRHGLGPIILPTLLKFVTLDREGEPAQRRVVRQALQPQERTVVDAFVDARLLVSRGEKSHGAATQLEVAHAALMRQWAPLRDAIEDSRVSLRMHAELEEEAIDWSRGEEDDSYLMRGSRLAAFSEWAALSKSEFSAAETTFLKASRELASRELISTRRRNRRLRRQLSGTVVLLAIAVASSGLAIRQTGAAAKQTALAVSRQLITASLSLRNTQPDASLLLGVEALKRAPTETEEDSRLTLLQELNRPFHLSRQIVVGTDALNAVAFNRDGSLIAAADDDGSIRLFTVADGRQYGRPLLGHGNWVHGVAISPDGSLIASAGKDGTVRLWDAATGQQHGRALTGHVGGVSNVVFSPDGSHLASGGEDGTICIWDVATATRLRAIRAAKASPIWDVRFSPLGVLVASASADGTVRLWNSATGQEQGAPMVGHVGWVNGAAFSRDGTTLASAGADGSVRLWDVRTGRPRGQLLNERAGEASSVVFSRDGSMLISGCRDGTVRLWSVRTGQEIGDPLLGHTNAVRGVALSPNGDVIASASYDGTIRLWAINASPAEGQSLAVDSGRVNRLAFSKDGAMIASVGADGLLRLWNVATGRQSARIPAGSGWVDSVAFSPDGSKLASAGADGTVRIWDARTGNEFGRPMIGHAGEVSDVTFRADGAVLYSSGRDSTIRFWDVATQRELRGPINTDAGQLLALAANPKQPFLASADEDGTVRVWDPRTGQEVGQPLRGHTGWVLDVAISPDGRTIASASGDGTIRLWNTSSGRPRSLTLVGHTGEVNAVAFGADGSTVASASKDGTVRFWDVSSGRLRGTPLTNGPDDVTALALNPSADQLAEASADGSIRLLSFDARSLVSEACRAANRNLSGSEWTRYVGPELTYAHICPEFG
jgi:WD40 repeat protein